MEDQVIIYTDGASRGNPGLSGIGVYALLPDGKKIEACGFIGKKTNNEAEYKALIYALFMAKQQKWKNVLIKADSLLLVNQVKNIYKIKNLNLLKLYDQVQYYLAGVNTDYSKGTPPFTSFQIIHIPRNENKDADRLANKAIDQAIAGGVNTELAYM